MEEINKEIINKPRKMKELKNGRSKLLACDVPVLLNIMTDRGFYHRQLAEMLGYERGYFTKALQRKAVGMKCVELLKEKYNILPQQYGVVGYEEEEQSMAKTEEKVMNDVKKKVLEKLGKTTDENTIKVKLELSISKDELSELIKSAVLDAFNSL